MMLGRKMRGFTLIESVIVLVVLAAAAAGVLLIFAEATARSADPMLRAQAQAIAMAYMDEILLQAYADPETSAVGATEEASRSDYDDVWDYDIINAQPPADRTGTVIGALSDYSVSVDVSGGAPAVITVSVSHVTGKVSYELVSERANY
jgi:MSHA pilin protein MshD